MSEFAGSLRRGPDVEHVVDGWVDVVGETMNPGQSGSGSRTEFCVRVSLVTP
jgi:hypothetical protein